MKIKKTVLFVGYSCNNNCLFCINEDKRMLNAKSTHEVMSEMLEARKRGTTYLELIGGEETIRPDFIKLIEAAKKLKFKQITIATNGRMFSYKKFAQETIKAGVTGIIFSIHGPTAKLHDTLTQVQGSFQQLMLGIENVKKLKFKNIGANTTIVKQNYRSLFLIGKLIDSLGIDNAEFIFVDPNYGGAKNNFAKIVPRISRCAPYVRQCLELGRKNKASHWHVRYVPLCYFTDHLDQISELHENRLFETEHIAPDFVNSDVAKGRKICGRLKKKTCVECFYDNICEGIWVEYVRQYGDAELVIPKFKHS